MEEKKKPEGQQKLSREEIIQKFNELLADYQKLQRQYQGAIEALNNIDATSFFLNYALKVMEHPELYNDKFVNLCSEKIEFILTRFAGNMQFEQEEANEA